MQVLNESITTHKRTVIFESEPAAPIVLAQIEAGHSQEANALTGFEFSQLLEALDHDESVIQNSIRKDAQVGPGNVMRNSAAAMVAGNIISYAIIESRFAATPRSHALAIGLVIGNVFGHVARIGFESIWKGYRQTNQEKLGAVAVKRFELLQLATTNQTE